MKINQQADGPASLDLGGISSQTRIGELNRAVNAAASSAGSRPETGTSESTVVNISGNARELVQSILNGAPVAAGDAATGASTASAVKSESGSGSAVSGGAEEWGGDAIRDRIMKEATSPDIALGDADQARESANLQALQIKQQLSTQALGLANQAPQTLQSLFFG